MTVKGKDGELRSSDLIKWGGFLFTIITAIVSVVWRFAEVQGEFNQLSAQFGEYKIQQASDNARRDKRLDDDENANAQLRQSLNDFGTKLEVAVTILHRLDERMPETPPKN